MKTFFILEDDSNRMERFNSIFKKRFDKNYIIYSSDNVEKAKAIFADHYPFDTIFLDHDLDNKIYVSSKEKNTGYSFATWMEENYKDSIKKQQIIIHSMNTVGANNIKSVLPNSSIIPFNVLIKSIWQKIEKSL